MGSESKSNWGKTALKLFGVGKSQTPAELRDEDDSKLPFGLRTQMLSEPKALMYRALVAASAADAVVFAKVRLSDFLFVSGGGDDLKHAIKMDRKFVDFLLCDPFSMQPLLVIELGIPTEDGEKAKTRDPFITRALKTSGIKLLKVEARPSYPVRDLRDMLLPYIKQQREASRRPASNSSASNSSASNSTAATSRAATSTSDDSQSDAANEHAKNVS